MPCTCPTLSFSLSPSFPLCLCLCPGCYFQLLSFFLSFCRSAPPTACMPSLSLSLFLRLKICALLDFYYIDFEARVLGNGLAVLFSNTIPFKTSWLIFYCKVGLHFERRVFDKSNLLWSLKIQCKLPSTN